MAHLISTIKIGPRILVGFGIVLLLLILLAVSSYRSLSGAATRGDEYAHFAGQVEDIRGIEADVSNMRRFVVKYGYTGDPGALAESRNRGMALLAELRAAQATYRSEARRAEMGRMIELASEYVGSFQKLQDMQASKGDSVATMSKAGSVGEQELAKAIDVLKAAHDVNQALDLGDIRAIWIEARLSANKFIAAPSGATADDARKLIEKVKSEIQRTAAKQTSSEAAGVLQNCLALADSYLKAYETVVVSTDTVNTLVNDKMAELARQFAGIAETISQDLRDTNKAVAVENKASNDSAVEELLFGSLFAIVLGAVFAWVISGSIRVPILAMTVTMTRLAGGDKSVQIPGLDNRDEIGEMAMAVNIFKENALRVERLQAEQALEKQRAEEQRQVALIKMADQFEAKVGGVVQTVTSAAVQLQASSKQMASSAAQTSVLATSVATASEEASSNVQTVASATEELAASINEISKQVSKSQVVADKADAEARHTTELIQKLSQDVSSIGEIVNLINDIASQTNLLALNATIEAARAGDAGKGFAVVASEVKNLANQTGRATDEIASKIAAVQEGTSNAVMAISSISSVINDMAEIGGSVAAAVQQQTAATGEIARNVDQAASGTQEVSKNIGLVETAAGETGQAATQISESSEDLSKQANLLKMEMARFLDQVRNDKGTRKLAEWDGSLAVGIREIDDHHRESIEQINSLFSQLMKGEGLQQAKALIQSFANGMTRHLKSEEEQMSRAAYPDLAIHRGEHEVFGARFRQLQHDADAGQINPIAVMEFAGDWLTHHIQKHDMAFAAFMKTKKAA